MVEESISIEELWNKLISEGVEPHKYNNYEVLDCNNVETLTYGNKYVAIKWVSRHKTSKHLIKIVVKVEGSNLSDDSFYDVTVTTDHVCMRYDKDHFFENINAKNLRVNDYVSVYDEVNKLEVVGLIYIIDDLGITDEWVYDLEVEDDMHSFYADNILVHNSQFINLQGVTDYIRSKYNLPSQIKNWSQTHRNELWKIVSDFTNNEINPFVRNLVHTYCGTTNQDVLTYELEYMGDVGIYEVKKHYAVHKIFDEGDPVDYIKYSGIELKKASVPKEMKQFLAEIYEGVLLNNWGESEYTEYVNSLFNKFKQFTINEVALWKGYGTERQSTGFLQMEKGATGISKACSYYNQLISALNLGKKYDTILLGNKVRFCYIEKSNKYGINCIAFPDGGWPSEFDKLFKVDYQTMFDKIILSPLKGFREACKFSDSDPTKQVLFDIFSL